MKSALALAVLVAFAACKRAPEEGPVAVPTKEVVAGVAMIDFTSDEAKFTARLPGEWGAMPEKYFEPSRGISMWDGKATHITISKYPETDKQYTDARKYAETFWMLTGKDQPEITQEKIGDNAVLRLHYERMPFPKRTRNDPPNRLDYALFPVKGGFYEVRHTAPVDTYQKTLPVFEAVVRSFKPKL